MRRTTTQYAKLSNKNWFDMTVEEQEVELEELDKPISPRQLKPLSKEQRSIWDRMRKSKPNVSIRVSNGRSDIVVRLDDDLMERAQAYARRNKTDLVRMIDRGLRGLLAFSE